MSGRRADRILSGDLCDRLHVVRRVPVGTASAFRLTDTTVSGAIAHLEQVTGTPLVSLGARSRPGVGRPDRRVRRSAQPGGREMGRTTAARAWEQAGEGAGRWRAPVDDVVLPVAERHGDPNLRSR